jgi:hypothetical protein
MKRTFETSEKVHHGKAAVAGTKSTLDEKVRSTNPSVAALRNSASWKVYPAEFEVGFRARSTDRGMFNVGAIFDLNILL